MASAEGQADKVVQLVFQAVWYAPAQLVEAEVQICQVGEAAQPRRYLPAQLVVAVGIVALEYILFGIMHHLAIALVGLGIAASYYLPTHFAGDAAPVVSAVLILAVVVVAPLSQLQPTESGSITLSGVRSATSLTYDFAPNDDTAQASEEDETGVSAE